MTKVVMSLAEVVLGGLSLGCQLAAHALASWRILCVTVLYLHVYLGGMVTKLQLIHCCDILDAWKYSSDFCVTIVDVRCDWRFGDVWWCDIEGTSGGWRI
jgi:hypothetical protein